MTTPTRQQAYATAQGTSPIPAFVFRDRDPLTTDVTYDMYTGWVNTVTKAIWYLEAFLPAAGLITAQWRAIGPIVVSTVDPATSDYQYPIGQEWINTATLTYWALVSIVGTTATWADLSSGAATGLLTLTGSSGGGAILGDGARNINIAGSAGVTVTGTPGTNTLTVALTGGSQAVDSLLVDAATFPGTNPVFPNAMGDIMVTGAQIAAASTANVIQTNSLAVNTYTVQVQRSKTELGSNAPSNGVCHFNGNQFTVDNNAYVSLSIPVPGTAINIQTFTTTGVYTPTLGMKYAIVEIVGGGGGGGGGTQNLNNDSIIAGGGGGGGYTKAVFTSATIGASQVVTIGTGGAGGTGALSNGGNGIASSFGALLVANGGSGGVAALILNGAPYPGFTAGGLGGTITTPGSYSITGQHGDQGYNWRSGSADITMCTSGYGGCSFLSSCAGPTRVETSVLIATAEAGNNYGGGGAGGAAAPSGGAPSMSTGGAGAPGLCIVTEYI